MRCVARIHGRLLVRAAILLTLLGGYGCAGANQPVKTYPVRGKVALADGKPFPGGLIEFRSTTHPTATIKGEIASADGSFSLSTLLVVGNRNETFSGAPPGDYRVTIIPLGQRKQVGQRSIFLPKTYRVKAQDDNQLVLMVRPQTGRR